MKQNRSIAVAVAFAQAPHPVPPGERDMVAARIARERALHGLGAIAGEPLALSVSHLEGRGACIAHRGRLRVGIDLVRTRSVRRQEQRYFLSWSERQQRVPFSPAERWGLKEAAWKALHCTRAQPFHALKLVHDASGRVCAVRVDRQEHAATAMVVKPWPEFYATILLVEDA